MTDERSPLEWEILAEQAHALARATELLETSLAMLRRLDRPGGEAAPEPALRESLLDEAGTRLWHLIVQREAMGATHHDILYEVLRVPPEVRCRANHRTAASMRR